MVFLTLDVCMWEEKTELRFGWSLSVVFQSQTYLALARCHVVNTEPRRLRRKSRKIKWKLSKAKNQSSFTTNDNFQEKAWKLRIYSMKSRLEACTVHVFSDSVLRTGTEALDPISASEIKETKAEAVINK